MVGRPRAFDERDVVLRAAAVFARLGYAGTSVDQLLETTGLQRGSLYQAFGSKAGLFRAAIQQGIDGDDGDLLADLFVVAIWERVRDDRTLLPLLQAVSERLVSTRGLPIQDIVYERLLLRLAAAKK